MASYICIALLAAALAMLPPVSRAAGEGDTYLAATLVKVIDGDTIKVQLASGPITIRLHGIDAPERKEPFGTAATKALRTLVEGQALEIIPVEQSDSYGRMIATVLVQGRNVNASMVETGYAWAYRRYLRRTAADRRYCTLEARARQVRRGLWSDPPDDWLPPWTFRARQRGGTWATPSYAGETEETCIAAIGKRQPR